MSTPTMTDAEAVAVLTQRIVDLERERCNALELASLGNVFYVPEREHYEARRHALAVDIAALRAAVAALDAPVVPDEVRAIANLVIRDTDHPDVVDYTATERHARTLAQFVRSLGGGR